MADPYLSQAAVFLIDTLFGLYIFAVMLRFLMQWARVDFYNPVAQFLVKATNPPLVPLRRIIPGLGGIDLAAIVLLIGLQVLDLILINLAFGHRGSAEGVVVTALGELLSTLITLYFVTILIEVILSWVAQGSYNPFAYMVQQLNRPLLAPARRLIPPMGGMDLSPVVVMIALQLARILLVAPLMDMGRGLGG